MCARVMDEGSCKGGCGRAEENITSGEMRGCHSGRKIKVCAAGGKAGPWLRGKQAELTEWLNREMREASLNYKQQVGIRRGIRSTMEQGIRGRRGEKNS